MTILEKLKKLIAAHGGDAHAVETVHKAVDMLVELEGAEARRQVRKPVQASKPSNPVDET